MPTLRQYAYFVAVAEELHFHRAADRLNVAQPALSQQIKMMEEELDLRLFDRSNRRVALSEAGEILLPEARALLRQAARTRDLADRTSRGVVGKLDIGFVPSAAFCGVMAQAIRIYRQTSPDVRLVWHEALMDVQIAEISAGRIDLGFVRLPAEGLEPQLKTRVLMREKIVLVVPENHALADRSSARMIDLKHSDFIMSPLPTNIGLSATMQKLCARADFVPRMVQSARQLTTMLNLVGGGVGVALLPESMLSLPIPGVRKLELLDPDAFSEVAILHVEPATSMPVRRFLEALDTLSGSDV